jgi:hypothetical protein
MTDLKHGDEVRINKTGRIVILEGINPRLDYDPEDETWAEGSLDGNPWTIDRPEDVTLLRRAKDVPARVLPTHKELVDAFSSALHSTFGDDVSVDETDTGGEPLGQFLAYGTSSTGQRFGCRVTISEIERTDF